MQDVALDRILEVGAMGTDDPVGVACSRDELRRHRIAGCPQLHRLAVNRVGAAQDGGGGVHGVLVGADSF